MVGTAIGAILGCLWWGVRHAWSPGVAAAVVVAADLGLTGLLHMDGLVDAADGLLPPHAGVARRLEVMRDPAAGAFGTVTVAAVLLLRWAALDSIHPSVLLLAGVWAASRTLMAVVALFVPYARTGGGLASAFLGADRPGGRTDVGVAGGRPLVMLRVTVLSSGVTLALAGCMLWRPVGGVVALAAGCAAGAGVAWLGSAKLGGFTGDVLGAAGVVAETTALVVAAARW